MEVFDKPFADTVNVCSPSTVSDATIHVAEKFPDASVTAFGRLYASPLGGETAIETVSPATPTVPTFKDPLIDTVSPLTYSCLFVATPKVKVPTIFLYNKYKRTMIHTTIKIIAVI
ncbi:MAG: hypothetical protein LUQ42_05555 [Methanomicrobiales archaeon]|nr:hypothetical protein [Methanomicrobiales archaeon]